VVIENEAESVGSLDGASFICVVAEASFNCVVVGILWNISFAFRFCFAQTKSD
jgi:hypothetical protein